MRYLTQVVDEQLSSRGLSATPLALTQSQKSPNHFRISTSKPGELKVLHNWRVQKRAARTLPRFNGAVQNGGTSSLFPLPSLRRLLVRLPLPLRRVVPSSIS